MVKLNELHLFAGAGGGILGGMLLGHTTVCAVEIDPYCRKVLFQRQRDGILQKFPIWDDVRTFDGKPWRGKIDVLCGGFPCQDISCAGKGAGIDGERSGLWREMARIIGEIRPNFTFVENSAMLISRGLDRVLGELSEMGYDARWGIVSAENAGLVHKRERIWILSHARSVNIESRNGQNIRNQKDEWSKKKIRSHYREQDRNLEGAVAVLREFRASVPAPVIIRNDNGVACLLDRLHAIGNGKVPSVAALAWEILSEGLI